MKEKLKWLIAPLIIFSCVFYVVLCLSGCGEVNEPTTEIQTHNVLGINSLVEIPIGDGLYYDYTTGIVYWWNGVLDDSHYTSTTPTPYYSPNGLLYRYIPETSELEEIERYCDCVKGEK